MTFPTFRRSILAAAFAAFVAAPVFAQEGRTDAASQPPPATQPGKRSILDIQNDSLAAQQELA